MIISPFSHTQCVLTYAMQAIIAVYDWNVLATCHSLYIKEHHLVSFRMLKYAAVRGGLSLLAVRRACLLSRSVHSAPQSEYRPIKKVMVANRGKTHIVIHTQSLCDPGKPWYS